MAFSVCKVAWRTRPVVECSGPRERAVPQCRDSSSGWRREITKRTARSAVSTAKADEQGTGGVGYDSAPTVRETAEMHWPTIVVRVPENARSTCSLSHESFWWLGCGLVGTSKKRKKYKLDEPSLTKLIHDHEHGGWNRFAGIELRWRSSCSTAGGSNGLSRTLHPASSNFNGHDGARPCRILCTVRPRVVPDGLPLKPVPVQFVR